MFEAAIFDGDGTLADTRRARVISFQIALLENGLDVSNSFLERWIDLERQISGYFVLKRSKSGQISG
ncbi:MAG: hypothetical protein LBQ98_06935 [Nitrososphaerota archaeon]|jgi:beta-phosphoglucomutase-like phosphatase (HAD superfamily)|nr:hypothetical protein [Nitrososphaerota archaeon]